MKKILIVGGGASGIMAALEVKDETNYVAIYEKKERIGKKLLSTGNGRCNFTNAFMGKDFYYCDNPDFVEDILNEFGHNDLLKYFHSLGLLYKEKNGYFYPVSDQASSVLDCLRFNLKEKEIDIHTETEVTKIVSFSSGYKVFTGQGSAYFDKVIVSCGGMAGLSKNETSNGYKLLKELGHTQTKLYPSLTKLYCEGLNFKALAGVKSECRLSLLNNDSLQMEAEGEVLFADYGLSGIVTFQISHRAAELLDNGGRVTCRLDLLPGITSDDFVSFLNEKYLLHCEDTLEEFMAGIHNKKLCTEILKSMGLSLNSMVKNLDKTYLIKCFMKLKVLEVKVLKSGDFLNSQVTGGGIKTSEVTKNLESKLCPGLFITGELLDVDGLCGGYNLQWAFSTGILAGRAARKE